MKFYSPLRYPGGKGKIADYFRQIIVENNLQNGTYIEPYAGGCSIALKLLIEKDVSRIIINDADRSIYAFWHSVLYETEELCKLISDTKINITNWRKQKLIQKIKGEVTLLELGFSTFFLNRTNRSGILNAGAIGGIKQKGTWKINARFNKEDLKQRIKIIAANKNKITLYNLDALDLIEKLSAEKISKALFYFDPPYYVKGAGLYLNHYECEDHAKVAAAIKALSKEKWVITYDYVLPIRNLYKEYSSIKFTLNYSAAKSSIGTEIMIFSDGLKKPDIKLGV